MERAVYLKRLELQGFKSFAGRTELEFDGGITAIVGPNGSGKSNLADALRWVLAEQSGRLLRTRKTEDAIFAGSSRRSSLGMAQVSVALDNTVSWLPIDFSEVVISRRAYRSGESEFFINGRRVRQKDVVELLLKGNVGQNSYTVLGQGLVEAALSLRPEERRNLIEEAADIKRHRISLAEAQDKLAATRTNLERAELIAQELEPQVLRLKRQAKRAQEYAQLNDSFRKALTAWYGYLWQEAEHSLFEAESAAKSRRDKRSKVQEDLTLTQEGLAQRRSQLQEMRQQIAAKDEQLREGQGEVHRLSQTLTLDEERLALGRQQGKDLALELRALEEEQALLEEQLEGAQGALVGVQQGAEHQGRELAQHRQELAQLEALYREKVVELAKAQKLEEQRIAQLSEIASRLAQWQERCQELSRQRERDEERSQRLAGELAALSKELKALQDMDRGLAEHLTLVAAERQGQAQQEEQARTWAASRREEGNALEKRAGDLEARLELLRQLAAQGQGLKEGARRLLEAQQLKGVLGTIVQHIEVPSGLERAIESALEQHVDAVAVEHRQHAFEALWYLAQNGGGRAALVPLDSLSAESRPSSPRAAGVIGIASRLVTCHALYQGAIEALLGGVLVVEDLYVAQAMQLTWPGPIVTRRGEVLYPWGGMAGGLATNGDDDSALARERQLRELPQAIASLRAQMAVAQVSLQEAEEQLRREREAQAQLAEKERQARAEKQGLAQEIGRLRRRWDSLRSELKAHIHLARQRREEYEYAQSRLAQVMRQQQEEPSPAQDGPTPLGEVRQGVTRLDETRSSLKSAIAEGSAQLSGAERERESHRALVESYTSSLHRIRSRLESGAGKVRQLESETRGLQLRLAAEEQRKLSLEQGVQELHRGLAPLKERVESLTQEEASLASREASLQRALLDAERQVLEVEAGVHEAVRELNNLRATMENEGIAPQETNPSQQDPEVLKRRVERLRSQLRSLGYASPEIVEEYQEAEARHQFLTTQIRDLEETQRGLLGAIAELKQLMEHQFQDAFQKVAEEFERYFATLFGGGVARLVLTDPENPAETGVDIVARPPGKRIQNLALLSGGERALTAIALLFALLKTNPVPFCVLDEVDAALDEANSQRFAEVLHNLARQTQFIIITHNRITIEAAQTIYGVSMGEDKVSRILSLRLDGQSKGGENGESWGVEALGGD